MRLTTYSDYALRVLIYLGTQRPGEVVTVGTIAGAYGVSHHHLVKVVQALRDLGHVETVRGKAGGLRLARAPESIVVGELIRATEPDFELVECFSSKQDDCPISGACRLEDLLDQAKQAFLSVLDGKTLADLLVNRRVLARRLAMVPLRPAR